MALVLTLKRMDACRGRDRKANFVKKKRKVEKESKKEKKARKEQKKKKKKKKKGKGANQKSDSNFLVFSSKA